MQKNHTSTIDLHNIQDDIYLGFLAQQILKTEKASHQLSFFGGKPIWLYQPTTDQQKCRDCNINLCFMGQMYCPFNADHCYHRILYFLFCSKCGREFRCIRQQADKSWVPTTISSNVRDICEARELQNGSYPRNEFIKLQSRLKIQIEQEEAIQQAESDEEEDVMNEVSQQQQVIKMEESSKQERQPEIKENQNPEQKMEEKDHLFEVYKKAIVQLDCPNVIYTDTPLPYNKRPLNPQHFCSCGSKLLLEVQITQKILSMDNRPESLLLGMDWGSIFVYTCSASCAKSSEEEVVVQYEIDAVTDQDLKKLNKKKKNKQKKQKKTASKSKSKSKSKGSSNEKQEKPESKEEKKQEEGDWD